MSRPRCLAVMYHYVRDRRGGEHADIAGLDVAAFTAQLDALCEVLAPVDWPSLVAWRAGRGALPADAVLLTFDDGLLDHAEVVAPILESRGMRGVFFVQTRVLIEPVMSAAHQIHLLLCRMGTESLGEAVADWLARHGAAEERPEDVGEAQRVYHYETPERARLKYLITQALPLETRDRMIGELFGEHVGSARDYAARWYMRWEHLSALQKAGHTVGGHGHDHVPLVRLAPAGQARDMGQCAAVLRDGLGHDRRPFSYPYGSCDADVARRCACSGFVNGFTTRQGWIEASNDVHGLCRVDTIHVEAMLEREFQCQKA